MKKCLFCNIVQKKFPPFVIYEDDICLAFLDKNPIRNGHILLIPKKHYPYIFNLEDKLFFYLFAKAKELSSYLEKAIGAKRIGLVVSGVSIPHTHIHLVPVYRQKDLNPNLSKPATTAELLLVQNLISKVMK